MKTVLVIGGGGREHAIVSCLRKSAQVGKIYAVPGNAGIAEIAECVSLGETDIDGLLSFAKDKHVDLTVVGPELSLSLGIVDKFKSEGLTIFGPSASAARIETSKVFANELMSKYSIPTAHYEVFDDYDEAVCYVRSHAFPVVVKYEGLAAGKGVVVAENLLQAQSAIDDMLLSHKYGDGRVVIEDFLEGEEFSFMCFVSGNDVCPMPLARDYKRAFDGDKGPNTGGMGAFSPLPFIDGDDADWAYRNIMCRAAGALVAEGAPFVGVLYGGLIKTKDGIKVIEFNARFGDPETEIVLPMLKGDAYDIFYSVAAGRKLPAVDWDNKCSVGVVLASRGYPMSYQNGFIIGGLQDIDAQVFHMGTALREGNFTTNGGRVLFISVAAESFAEARSKLYNEVSKVVCENFFYRKDIGVNNVN